ncbi:hypothetical protein RND71_010219 [Anisodus tanguticus]|uniref:Pyruvate dehydrogenase E1 component subunit beta n=1 Tax=Anisodus tanguticus TaxID=243964 RepID=A0AAE1SJF8_9SOLA|nr:hypothetical protein RND71_010219 [Anisodus tanguticus]
MSGIIGRTMASKRISALMTVRDALNSALDEEMSADPKVFVMGEEITKGLLDKYGPERVLDTPITEAIDHIINSAAKANYMAAGQISVPIVFRGPNGAAAGVGAQHSQVKSGCSEHQGGWRKYELDDARLLCGMVWFMSRIKGTSSILFRRCSWLAQSCYQGSGSCCVSGKRIAIEHEGKDVTITAFSKMVGYALQAAEILAKEGISAEVINLRSIRPLDRPAINASVRKTNRLVTLEEGFPQHGVGAEICASVVEESFEYLDAPVERITGADVPMPYAANLERLAVPQVEDIVRAAKRACYRSRN